MKVNTTNLSNSYYTNNNVCIVVYFDVNYIFNLLKYNYINIFFRSVRRHSGRVCRAQSQLSAEIDISRASLANIEAGLRIVCHIDIDRVWCYLEEVRPEDIYRELGRSVRRYRTGAHRTQAQLSAEISISRASLANIEAGRQQVLLHHLYAIADALDLDSPSDLMPVPPPPNAEPADLPLPAEGLSETQRQEVLRLMGSVMRNGDQNETEAD